MKNLADRINEAHPPLEGDLTPAQRAGVTPKSVGRIAFELYNEGGANPGKTFDGRPVPPWEGLSDDVRAKWQTGGAGLLKRIGAMARDIAEVAGPVIDIDLQDAEEFDFLLGELITHGVPDREEIKAMHAASQARPTAKRHAWGEGDNPACNVCGVRARDQLASDCPFPQVG